MFIKIIFIVSNNSLNVQVEQKIISINTLHGYLDKI